MIKKRLNIISFIPISFLAFIIFLYVLSIQSYKIPITNNDTIEISLMKEAYKPNLKEITLTLLNSLQSVDDYVKHKEVYLENETIIISIKTTNLNKKSKDIENMINRYLNLIKKNNISLSSNVLIKDKVVTPNKIDKLKPTIENIEYFLSKEELNNLIINDEKFILQ